MIKKDLQIRLANTIAELQRAHPIKVGIDGIDAAGKTTLAAELAVILKQEDRPIIQASLDDFHNPKRVRSCRGDLSPEGYYYDSFNYGALIDKLLSPLGPDGDGTYQAAAFDYRLDSPVDPSVCQATADAILLFDGVFLQRPILERHWDFVIYVDISFEESLTRAINRDSPYLGLAETIEKRYRRRYIPGQQQYLEACQPKERADVVIDNNSPADPKLVSWSGRHWQALGVKARG